NERTKAAAQPAAHLRQAVGRLVVVRNRGVLIHSGLLRRSMRLVRWSGSFHVERGTGAWPAIDASALAKGGDSTRRAKCGKTGCRSQVQGRFRIQVSGYRPRPARPPVCGLRQVASTGSIEVQVVDRFGASPGRWGPIGGVAVIQEHDVAGGV